MKKLILCVLLLSSPLASAQQAPTQKIKACFSEYREELVSAALLVAKTNGYFKDEGIEVEFSQSLWSPGTSQSDPFVGSNANPEKKDLYIFGTGRDVAAIKALAAGECDFLSTSFEALLLSGAETKNMTAVALYSYGGKYDTSLMVRSDSKVKSVKELRGKTIRIGQIGTRLVLEKILKKNGMSLDDVKVVVTFPDTLPASLASGEIEAVIAYSPTTPLLLANKSARVLVPNVFSTYAGPFVPHSLLLANKTKGAASKESYEKFTRAFKRAAEYIRKNPLSTVSAMNANQTLPHSTLNYSGYSPATVEKSASFFRISEPYLVGDQSSAYGPGQLYKSMVSFHGSLREIEYLKKDADVSAIAEMFKISGI